MKDRRASQELSRRKFLDAFVGAAAAVVAAALATPVVGYFLSPLLKKTAGKTTVPIARTSEVPIDIPTFFSYEEAIRDAWVTTTTSKGAWIVNKDGKNFIVYDPHCTHLGCPYYWNPEKQIFQCPCHGGDFDINGKVLAGPPPRPLDKLAFTIVDDTIQLITS